MEKLQQYDGWSNELKRQTMQFGYRYDYQSRKVEKTDREIPYWLADVVGNKFDQLIVNKYEKGQGISKHTDHKTYFNN